MGSNIFQVDISLNSTLQVLLYFILILFQKHILISVYFLFKANLLYPGDPKAPAKETYKPPAPVKAAPPPAPVQPAAPSYGPPQTTPAPAPAAPAYNPPEPAPLGYDEPAPVYNNPFVAQPKPTTAAPPPVYQQPASTPAVYVGQPSYVPSYPSIQYVPAQPTPAAPTPAPTTPAPAPPVYNR